MFLLHMLQNYNKWKVLQIFFDHPLVREFQLREISRKINLASPSVKNYLEELEKEQFIIKQKNRVQNYPIYFANRDYKNFKYFKKIDLQERLFSSGLIAFPNDTFLPDAIVLFGSASKGEDTELSDIDLFISSKMKKIELTKYEKVLNRKINLLFEPDFNKFSKELKNNILNGIALSGYVKVF